MPEQAEWEDGCTAGLWPPRKPTPPDGDDYTHAHQTPVAIDCRTSAEKVKQQFADLETAVLVLTDEVRHLRADIARMVAGESSL